MFFAFIKECSDSGMCMSCASTNIVMFSTFPQVKLVLNPGWETLNSGVLYGNRYLGFSALSASGLSASIKKIILF